VVNQSRKIWPRLVPVLGLALMLPLPPGQDYTCPNCHETFQFPSNAGAYREAFIRNHSLVCRSSSVLPPVLPDPAQVRRIRELEEQKAVAELAKLMAQAYLDMQRRQMRDQAEFLIAQTRKIHAAWREFQRRVDDVIDENDNRLAEIRRQQRIAPKLHELAAAAESERGRWKSVTERVGQRAEDLVSRLASREHDLMGSLEAMRARGLIAGPAEHLPTPPAPGDGRDVDWGVAVPRVQRRSLDSTYFPSQLRLGSNQPAWPVQRARAAPARRALPDPANISIKELLDLRARYELLKLSVERDAKTLASEVLATRRASRESLTALKQNNDKLRIAVDLAKRASHVYKGQLEQHYKDLCVAELRKAALNRLEKSIETRVGSRTLALGRTLVREARDELEKFTPYVSTLKRLQSFGDTMHGLGRPSGYMERLFEGIRASTYVHEDPAAADEAWAQIQKVRSDFARDLQDLGLPESFSETRRQIEKWFSQQ